MANKMSQADYIMHLATRFRTAIDLALEDGRFDNNQILRRFPFACCGVASDLLAIYLSENGFQTKYVCGSYYYSHIEDGSQSHAWLQYRDLVIDITGDQFKNNPVFLNYSLPVYVGKIDAMHKLFEVTERNIYDAVLCGGISGQGMQLYSVIKSYIIA